MPTDLPIWQLARTCLQQQVPVMLLQVLQSEGSSPGRQGFRMVVAADGQMAGSIGGGIMEQKLADLALNRLKKQALQPMVKQQIHSKDAPCNQSGMICSGEQTVAMLPLQMDALPQVEALISSLEQNEEGVLQLSPAGLVFHAGKRNPQNFRHSLQHEHDWHFEENTGPHSTLYIIGGGHVSLAFSRIMASLDFRLVVLDDRPDLNTLQQNTWAHRKVTCAYEELANYVPEGADSYVAIMTFGYRPDKIALKALLGRHYGYIGLMGAQAKIDQLWKELREEGVPEEHLQQVHAPIGLPIHSRTPAEIAISVAAQIIQVRNAGFGDAR